MHFIENKSGRRVVNPNRERYTRAADQPLRMFSNRKLMATVALVGTIHAASADEASDAVQVLLKLWKANLEASNRVCGGMKILKTEFVGDGKTYKMRLINRLEDGKVEDSIDEAPFRFLEEVVSPGIVHCRYPRSPFMGPSSAGGGSSASSGAIASMRRPLPTILSTTRTLSRK